MTAALNTAYDQLLTARSGSGGQDPRLVRLAALLNQTHLVTEASPTLALEGRRPPADVIRAIERLADSIEHGTAPPDIPPPWTDSPGARALCEALKGAVRIVTGKQVSDAELPSKPGLRERVGSFIAKIRGGREIRVFALRLMASIGVAAVFSEVVPVERSYWVVLTVAIVLRPDFGSVFARGLQRGIGTIVGAVAGAIILAIVPYGLWLLVPAAVLAALLPWGRLVNFGLMLTFLTPLIVVLLDLQSRSGWRLAEDRLVDTLLGCAIALLIGYAPWPGSWQAHLPQRFAEAVSRVARYTEQALAENSPDRSRLRRETSRYLSDLRTEFQRALSEPKAVSRRVSTWWPAAVALEQVVDAVTAIAVAVEHGAPAPSPDAVRRLAAVLNQVADAVRTGTRLPPDIELPDDEALRPVTDAVQGVLAMVS